MISRKGIFTLFNSLLLSMLFFIYSPCFAGKVESIENLKEVAKNYILKNVKVNSEESLDVQVSEPDKSFRMPLCSQEIVPALPKDVNKNAITSVELACNGVRSWHVFIPVTVRVYVKAIVANRTIYPKEAITESDLDYASYDKNSAYNGYFVNKDDVIGKEATRIISAGSVLSKTNTQLPLLVTRSQIIEVIARKGSIVVSMKGIAKSDGRLNETIKVVNPSSNKTLDAIVIGSNKAEAI